MSNIAWQRLEGGAVEYGTSGRKRRTFYLRLGRDVRKITSATPAQYDAVMMALSSGKRQIGLEGYHFGQALRDTEAARAIIAAPSASHAGLLFRDVPAARQDTVRAMVHASIGLTGGDGGSA